MDLCENVMDGIKKVIFLLFYVSVLAACIYVHCMHAWFWKKQRRILDPLELELEVVVNCDMCSRI